MRRRVLFFIICLIAAACTPEPKRGDSPDPIKIKEHINFLASDEMQGRGTGSEGNRRAAEYIADHFDNYRLAPKGTQGYFQPFTAKVTKVSVADSIRPARNVIGFLDNGAEYTIVIGAHYDHLGEGRQGSSKDPDPEGKIHNGADDNASGVAGLLEMARYFTSGTIKESYNFLFIAFSAEELGLVGSGYFTDHPTIPLNSINFMLNMDMIGRYNPERGLGIGGYGTSPSWPAIFEGVKGSEGEKGKGGQEGKIKFFTDPAGSGGSDHGSFYAKNLPVLFFHTGGHPDYHMPGDDIGKVDVKAEAAILEIGIRLIENAMELPKLEFKTSEP